VSDRELAGELRAFRVLTCAILLIPLVVGLVGAFGGLEGLAALFAEDRRVELAPAIRDHLRAVCWMFFGLVPLVGWTLVKPVERAMPFRIVVAVAIAAGVVRVIGAIVDGNPGLIAFVFAAMELGVLPVVLIWHSSIVRRLGA